MMNIEKTEIWLTCDRPLDGDGTAVRGFFGNMYRNRPEFHGHRGSDLIYKHPLIQYKVFGGSALVTGLKEGAYLLKAVPKLDHIEIHHEPCPILKQNMNDDAVPFGLADKMTHYSFITPWVALNEENYGAYRRLPKNREVRGSFLNRILVGNLLSMSKALGYTVDGEIIVESNVGEDAPITLKKDIILTTFKGTFETNFLIPDFWGIGKFSSRGCGTVRRVSGGQAI